MQLARAVLLLDHEAANLVEIGERSGARVTAQALQGPAPGVRNAFAMKPVKTLKSATPAVRRKMPMIRPGSVTGYLSPYPTVVIVT